MEGIIGDSHSLVDQDNEELETVEFERNVEQFKKTLDLEEKRLTELEAKYARIFEEVEEAYQEILEEKMKHRQEIDSAIAEREKISKAYLESCGSSVDLSPIESSMNFIEDNVLESTSNVSLDIEKIRCDLLQSCETQEDHLSTLKQHLQKKLKSDIVETD